MADDRIQKSSGLRLDSLWRSVNVGGRNLLRSALRLPDAPDKAFQAEYSPGTWNIYDSPDADPSKPIAQLQIADDYSEVSFISNLKTGAKEIFRRNAAGNLVPSGEGRRKKSAKQRSFLQLQFLLANKYLAKAEVGSGQERNALEQSVQVLKEGFQGERIGKLISALDQVPSVTPRERDQLVAGFAQTFARAQGVDAKRDTVASFGLSVVREMLESDQQEKLQRLVANLVKEVGS